MKDNEAESLEASRRIIHKLNGRIYGLERMNKEMCDSLIEVHKIALTYDCIQCGKERSLENCDGCVMYVQPTIEKATGKTIEELIDGI